MNDASKTYYLVTLGCAKNQIDSEAIELDLESVGATRTDSIDRADLILVNSCGFINDAKIETLDTIFNLHARRKSGSILVLCGCLPARYDLRASLGEVNLFLPSNAHNRLVPALREAGWELENHGGTVGRIKPLAPYSYLKISEGCDNFCSYCAIPYIKGAFASRPPDDVVREAQYLCAEGAKEIVLIAQDTTSYGKDLEIEDGLPGLLDRLSQIEQCRWIRLMYAHPAHLTAGAIEALARTDKVVKYLDLPLQHINDRILGLMNRKTDRCKIETVLKRLRAEIPGISLRTTIIVGFPGETDDEFGELLDFCEETRFDHLGIFKYSLEEGTAAAKLPGRVEDSVMEERYLTLLDLQNRISAETLGKKIGSTERVLLQEFGADGAVGRASFQAPEVDGQVIFEIDGGEEGDFVDVIIEKAEAYDLYGTSVE